MIEQEGMGNYPPVQEKIGAVKYSSSAPIKPDFFHCIPSDVAILSYLDWYPGATIGAVQFGMGYHRGNRNYTRIRREISSSIQRLIVTGYIRKDGVKNFLTEKGMQRC